MVMRVLPVPDIVQQMSERMEELESSVTTANRKLDRLLDEIRQMRVRENEVKAVSLAVETVRGTLTTTKDQVAMLCAMIEKTM
jgi:hypothetical protein